MYLSNRNIKSFKLFTFLNFFACSVIKTTNTARTLLKELKRAVTCHKSPLLQKQQHEKNKLFLYSVLSVPNKRRTNNKTTI